MTVFPKDFFWGAATSAYQVEGNNTNSDWWEWEKKTGLKETSGEACRQYQLYKQDFDLAQGLNHNAHRFSIEWSRIEPQEGEFSQEAIQHYQEVVSALRERKLEPVVTLHHFTLPIWFARLGGFAHKKAALYFLRYTRKVAESLGSQVRFWVTINEPLVYAYHAYILGVWPPQKTSIFLAQRVTDNLVLAHVKAYRAIHAIYQQKKFAPPLVSIAKNLQAFEPCLVNMRNKFAAYIRDRYYNLDLLKRLTGAKALDFIGANYYSRSLVEVEKWGVRNLIMDVCKKNHSQLAKNSMGWDIYPQGLYKLLLELKRFDLPIFILENGVCAADDNLRWEFIRMHLESLHRGMEEGAKVMGYLYWSLLDNFEWDKGFGPRFGLVGVDYQTFGRTVRDSARKFAEVCKTGSLTDGNA